MKNSDSERHLAVPSMKRLGSLRKRPFFHSKSFVASNHRAINANLSIFPFLKLLSFMLILPFD